MLATSVGAIAQTETSGRSLYHAEATKYSAFGSYQVACIFEFLRKKNFMEKSGLLQPLISIRPIL